MFSHEKLSEKLYYTILCSDFTYITYKIELNINTKIYSVRPYYFTNLDNIHKYIGHGELIATLEIPNDAQIYKDPSAEFWTADKINIGAVSLSSIDTF